MSGPETLGRMAQHFEALEHPRPCMSRRTARALTVACLCLAGLAGTAFYLAS